MDAQFDEIAATSVDSSSSESLFHLALPVRENSG